MPTAQSISLDSGDLWRRFQELPQATQLVTLFAEVGMQRTYCVGGVVRDLLLRQSPHAVTERQGGDYDFVVVGDAVQAGQRLAQRLSGQLTVHPEFRTATVVAAQLAFDLVTARGESYLRPGALPQIAPTEELAEDLARRDFTANTFAFGVTPDCAGKLLFFGPAPDDLGARILRVLHPQSFYDDPTRLFRLVRYQARLGFRVAPGTLALARAALAEGALATVTPQRLGNELRLLFGEAGAVAMEALVQADALGLAQALHPALSADHALLQRATGLLPMEQPAATTILAVWARAVPPAELGALLDGWAMPAPDRDRVLHAVKRAPCLAKELAGSIDNAKLGCLLEREPLESIVLAGALGASEAVRRWFNVVQSIKLEISGDDLIAAGLEQGPVVGQRLAAVLAAKRAGRCNGRAAELRYALSFTSPQHDGMA